MTKINLKTPSMTALCVAATVGMSNPAFAQAVTGGTGPGDPVTEVCTQDTFAGNVACGSSSTASGTASTAIGSNSRAEIESSTAIGANSWAVVTAATATGFRSRALDIGATAIGTGSTASRRSSTAIGQLSTSSGLNSVALGAFSNDGGVDNVVSVGSATGQRRIVNMAAGDVTATSTDAINGSQLFATNQNVASAQTTANSAVAQNIVQDTQIAAIQVVNTTQNNRLTALEALNLNTSSQIAGLQSGITGLQDQLNVNNRQTNGGIAAAMALGGAVIVPDSNVSMSFNLSTYRGQQGFSGSVIGRVSEKVYISGGVAGSTVKGSTGGRVGVTFGF